MNPILIGDRVIAAWDDGSTLYGTLVWREGHLWHIQDGRLGIHAINTMNANLVDIYKDVADD